MKSGRLLSVFAATSLAASSPALAQIDATKIAAQCTPSVVLIKGMTAEGEVTASGFIVDPSGTIVTNFHVIEGLKALAVRVSNGDVYDQVRVRAFDKRKDLAVLQIPAFGLPALPLANSDEAQPGQPIILIGNPKGLEASVATGIVSGIRDWGGFRVIQHDAASNPGNSGGPLLDAQGRVIGVLSFKLKETEGLNFAVPANYARGLLASQDSLTLEEFAVRVQGSVDLFSKTEDTAASFPRRWKQNVGGTYTIKILGENLYIEGDVPEEQKQFGVFGIGDYKKVGDRWVGRETGRFACTYTTGMSFRTNSWGGEQKVNACAYESTGEITLLSATRIEGFDEVYPEGTRFDCKKCAWDSKARRQKRPFVMIPD